MNDTPRPRSRMLRDDVGSKAWVSFAKGLAIVMVVFYHTALYFSEAGVSGVPGRLKVAFELFPIPAFFLISGVFSKRMADWSFPDLWRRRLLPILYLYLLWSVIRFFFYFVMPWLNAEVGAISARDPLALVAIVIGPANSYWFLYALLLFTVAAWLLRRVPRLLQIIPMLVLSAAITSGLISSDTVVWDRVGALFVFFLIGMHYSDAISNAVAKARPPSLGLALVGLAAVVLALYLPGLARVPFVATIGQALAVTVGILASKYLARLRPLAFIAEMGDKSLQIYVIHIYVISLLASGLGLVTTDEWPRFVDSAVLLLGVVIVLIMTLLIIKWTSRWRWLYIPPTRWLTSRAPRARA